MLMEWVLTFGRGRYHMDFMAAKHPLTVVLDPSFILFKKCWKLGAGGGEL